MRFPAYYVLASLTHEGLLISPLEAHQSLEEENLLSRTLSLHLGYCLGWCQNADSACCEVTCLLKNIFPRKNAFSSCRCRKADNVSHQLLFFLIFRLVTHFVRRQGLRLEFLCFFIWEILHKKVAGQYLTKSGPINRHEKQPVVNSLPAPQKKLQKNALETLLSLDEVVSKILFFFLLFAFVCLLFRSSL